MHLNPSVLVIGDHGDLICPTGVNPPSGSNNMLTTGFGKQIAVTIIAYAPQGKGYASHQEKHSYSGEDKMNLRNNGI